MLKSFKTEINPSEEQKVKIHKTIGTCRFIYNFYLAHNKELYQNGEKFMSSSKFRVWLNHEYLPQHPEYLWIKEAYSKAVTQAVNHGQTAFKKFFNHESAFPKFKKKGRSDVKMYFVKNNPKDCRCERHRVNIPSLGWVRIKEKGYIPTTKEGYIIKSGHVSMKAGRYYVSALIEIPDNKTADLSNEGIGIDLGLKDFAIVSNGKTYKNINKSARLKKLEKSIMFDKEIFKSQKRVDLLINDINEKIAKKQFELAIDRLHTFFKGYIEVLCEQIKIDIKDKSLDALYGELLKYIHDNEIFEEGITKDILSASKKIMKSFDYYRNNKSFAHTNDIMKQNEAEFLCMYIIDLYKFLYKINLIKK